MSTFKVEAVKILSVEKHPNADKLDLVTVLGWQCVAQRGVYKVGDIVIYIPIDSILPEKVEAALFGPDAKIKLSNHRVRTIKIRGAISQGMVASAETLGIKPRANGYTAIKEGDNLTEILEIKKYEPAEQITTKGGRRRTKKETNPYFYKYTDIENAKNYPNVFVDGEPVIITEKIHGTNFRAGWVPMVPDTFWKKVKQFFGRLEEWDFVFGSRNVQLQNGNPLPGEAAHENVYAKAVKKYDLRNRIPKGCIIYGEIYGEGIQNNYNYGMTRGEFGVAIFDVMVDGKYLDYDKFPAYTSWLYPTDGFRTVPVLYEGPFSLEKAKELTKGPSVLCSDQKVREGVVIKPVKETICHMGRKILKLISDEYLLKEDNTEFH